MGLIRLIGAELAGLFVDDEFLAIAILAVVALATIASYLLRQPALAGAVLLVGCITVLVVSALRARR